MSNTSQAVHKLPGGCFPAATPAPRETRAHLVRSLPHACRDAGEICAGEGGTEVSVRYAVATADAGEGRREPVSTHPPSAPRLLSSRLLFSAAFLILFSPFSSPCSHFCAFALRPRLPLAPPFSSLQRALLYRERC